MNQTLKHSGMLITELLDAHWANYGYVPKENEKKAHIEWAKGLDEADFRHALDPESHRIDSGGQRKRPNLATLRDIVRNRRLERSKIHIAEDQSILGKDCWYCSNGYVLTIYEQGGIWYSRILGRCKCSQGDKTGPLSKRRPVDPSVEIQDYARENEINCHDAVENMKYERNKHYREWLEEEREIKKKERKARFYPPQYYEQTDEPTKKEDDPPDYDFGDGFEREVEDIPF